VRTPRTLVCPGCRQPNEDLAARCSLCGRLFSQRPRRDALVLPPPLDRLPAPLVHLGTGFVLAAVLYVFTCGIFDTGVHCFFHECGGHAVVAWFFGMPAIPALWVTGVGAQRTFLAVAVWVALAAGAFLKRDRRNLAIGLGVAALVYPALAFTKAATILMLAGGHGGEIFWGAFFLYRAVRGGVFHEGERPLYAALGWLLAGGNVLLFSRLVTSEKARIFYATMSINEGIDNDFVRVSGIVHHSLRAVSVPMLLLAIAAPVAGIALGLRARRVALERGEPESVTDA
jgi:hypothetical protein